jgi:hypothetical protein
MIVVLMKLWLFTTTMETFPQAIRRPFEISYLNQNGALSGAQRLAFK